MYDSNRESEAARTYSNLKKVPKMSNLKPTDGGKQRSAKQMSQASMENLYDSESILKIIDPRMDESHKKKVLFSEVIEKSSKFTIHQDLAEQIFESFYLSEENSPWEKDFKIQLDGFEITCHKNLLLRKSKTFFEQVKSDLVKIESVSKKHYAALGTYLMRYIYDAPVTVPASMFFYVYQIGVHFEFTDLIVKMESFLSAQNVVTLLQEYDDFETEVKKFKAFEIPKSVKKKLIDFVVNNFDESIQEGVYSLSKIRNEEIIFKVILNEKVQSSKKYKIEVNNWLTENFLKIDTQLSSEISKLFENRIYSLLSQKKICKDENNICFFLVFEKKRNLREEYLKSLNIFGVYFDMISNENLVHLSQFLSILDLKEFLKQIKTSDYSKLLQFLLNYPSVIELSNQTEIASPQKRRQKNSIFELIDVYVDFSSVGLKDFIRFSENKDVPLKLLRRSCLEFLYGINERLCDLGIPGFESLLDTDLQED